MSNIKFSLGIYNKRFNCHGPENKNQKCPANPSLPKNSILMPNHPNISTKTRHAASIRIQSSGGGRMRLGGIKGGGIPPNTPFIPAYTTYDWTKHEAGDPAPRQRRWKGVASDDTGLRLFACEQGAPAGVSELFDKSLYISTDYGITWTDVWQPQSATPPAIGPPYDNSMDWISVCSDSTGENLGAITYDGSGAYSDDYGATWNYFVDLSGPTSVWGPRETSWNTIVSSSDGGVKYACSAKGPLKKWTSGTNWDMILGLTTSPTNPYPAGIIWTERLAGDPVPPERRWKGIASDTTGDKLFACTQGDVAGANHGLYISDDSGSIWKDTWTAGTLAPLPFESNMNWISACSSSDGENLGALTFDSSGAFSVNRGDNWTYFTDLSSASPYGVTDNSYNTITSSEEGLVKYVCSANGAVKISADSGATWAMCAGVTAAYPAGGPTSWTDISLGTNQAGRWSQICCDNTGQYVNAVARAGPAATVERGAFSNDFGVNWTFGSTALLNGLAVGSNKGTPNPLNPYGPATAPGEIVFVARQNDLMVSSDRGANFVSVLNKPTIPNLFGAVAVSDDGMVVATNVNSFPNGGYIYISVDYGQTGTFQAQSTGALGWPAGVPAPQATEAGSPGWTPQGLVISSDGTRLVAVSFGFVVWSAVITLGGTPSNVGAWTQLTGVPSYNWVTVCMSADGSVIALGGENSGTPTRICTSADFGSSWTEQPGSPLEKWNGGLACNSSGTEIFASYDGTGSGLSATGQIWRSSDTGVTWQVSIATGRSWGSLASNSAGDKIYAVVEDVFSGTGTGTGLIWRGLSGAGGTPAEWTGICCNTDGARMAVCNTTHIYISSDSGATLEQKQIATAPAEWSAIACGDDFMFQVAAEGYGTSTGRVWLSIDGGLNWTQKAGAGDPPSAQWKSVTINNDGTMIAAVVGGNTTNTTTLGSIWISEDSGLTWSEQTPTPGTKSWQSITTNTDGTMLAAAVGDGLLGGVSGTWVNRGQGPQNWGNESTPSIALSSVGDKLVAVASDDNIFLSTDYGVTWGNQTTPVATQKWRSVASNSDGTKLAAVVGPIGNIWLSTNSGVDWIEVAAATGPPIVTPPPPNQNWRSIASNSNGSILAAAIQLGTIYVSTDSGSNWSASTAPALAWRCIASDSAGTNLAATAYSDINGNIYVSSDSGMNWTDVTTLAGPSPPTNQLWTGIAVDSTATNLAAVMEYGNIWLSTNSGVGWVQVVAPGIPSSPTPSQFWSDVAMSSDGTVIVAVPFGGHIWKSTDSGAKWIKDTTAGSRNWRSVASNAVGDVLAAVVGDGPIWTWSNNDEGSMVAGNIWTSTGGAPPEWTGMCCSADGVKFAACNATHIFTSEDGGANLVARQAGSWRAIACDNTRTKLVAVIGWQANTGNIWLSTDSGATWTEKTGIGAPTLNQHWRSVASNSDGTVLIAAVGGDPGDTSKTGSIWLSEDSGATWKLQTTPGVQNWQTLSSNADGTRLAAAVSDGAEVPPSSDSVLGDIWTYDPIITPSVAATSCAPAPPYPTACIKPPRNTF